MVDFNWYGIKGAEDDWRVRAERLRAEIDANNYWYRVITLAVPRYATDEDAERVSLFLNMRMAATRRMARELAWLEKSLASDAEPGRADSRSPTPPQTIEGAGGRKKNHNAAIGVACLIVQGPLRGMLEESVLGSILLILSFAKLCHLGVQLLADARAWFAEIRTARDDLRVLRQLSERDLTRWYQSTRLRDYQRSAECSVTTT